MDDNRDRLPGESGQPRRGRPRDPAVDAAILTAAVDLLAEIGYARLTMEQVAARAGVGKASLYLRWPNKVGLVAEAIQQRAAVIPALPDTGSVATDMRAFLLALLQGRAAGERALAAVSGEIASNPELRQAWRQSMTGTLTACLRHIVEQAIARGELPAASDVELLAVLPLTLLQNWRLEHGQGPDAAAVERIVAQFYTPAPRPPSGKEAPAARGVRRKAPRNPAPPASSSHGIAP